MYLANPILKNYKYRIVYCCNRLPPWQYEISVVIRDLGEFMNCLLQFKDASISPMTLENYPDGL